MNIGNSKQKQISAENVHPRVSDEREHKDGSLAQCWQKSLRSSGIRVESTHLAQAVANTQAAFPRFEIQDSFTKWFRTNTFRLILDPDISMQLLPADTLVLLTFIETGGFYVGEATEQEAHRVLRHFFNALARCMEETATAGSRAHCSIGDPCPSK